MFRLLTVAVITAWFICATAEQRALKVHVVTWNVNSQNPPEDLSKLLGLEEGKQLPDIIVVGLQEVTMNPKNAFMDSLFPDKWTLKTNEILDREYTKVKSKNMVSVALLIYVKHEHAANLREIESFKLPTGFAGLYGNKGGVGINFRLYDRRFGFINAHLPAHDDAVDARIRDIKKIEGYRKSETWNPQDYRFWIGDLNFRIAEMSWDAETISNMIDQGLIEAVLANDQLKLLMSDKTVFADWNEAEIKFNPTYKVSIGDGSYNLKRRPAWTDRILYKSETGSEILNTEYDSVDGYFDSDHKPVKAEFKLAVDI